MTLTTGLTAVWPLTEVTRQLQLVGALEAGAVPDQVAGARLSRVPEQARVATEVPSTSSWSDCTESGWSASRVPPPLTVTLPRTEEPSAGDVRCRPSGTSPTWTVTTVLLTEVWRRDETRLQGVLADESRGVPGDRGRAEGEGQAGLLALVDVVDVELEPLGRVAAGQVDRAGEGHRDEAGDLAAGQRGDHRRGRRGVGGGGGRAQQGSQQRGDNEPATSAPHGPTLSLSNRVPSCSTAT